MGDGIGLVTTTHVPTLRSAASQQGPEVLSIDQDAQIQRQMHDLLRSVGEIKVTLHLWVVLHLQAEVIHGIQ